MTDLAASMASAEQAALVELDQRFRVPLMRHFRRHFSNSSEAEDLVQEVFVRLIHRGNIADLENLQAYVFEAARNVLKDRLRKVATRHEPSHEQFDLDRHDSADFSPEDVLLAKERLSNATSALLELPERTRMIFLLRRLEGMRYQEISDRFGISVSAVEKHVQRAIAHMARRRDPE